MSELTLVKHGGGGKNTYYTESNLTIKINTSNQTVVYFPAGMTWKDIKAFTAYGQTSSGYSAATIKMLTGNAINLGVINVQPNGYAVSPDATQIVVEPSVNGICRVVMLA